MALMITTPRYVQLTTAAGTRTTRYCACAYRNFSDCCMHAAHVLSAACHSHTTPKRVLPFVHGRVRPILLGSFRFRATYRGEKNETPVTALSPSCNGAYCSPLSHAYAWVGHVGKPPHSVIAPCTFVCDSIVAGRPPRTDSPYCSRGVEDFNPLNKKHPYCEMSGLPSTRGHVRAHHTRRRWLWRRPLTPRF